MQQYLNKDFAYFIGLQQSFDKKQNNHKVKMTFGSLEIGVLVEKANKHDELQQINLNVTKKKCCISKKINANCKTERTTN